MSNEAELNVEIGSFEVDGLKIACGLLRPAGHNRHAGILYIPGAPRTPRQEMISRFGTETIPALNDLGFTVMTFQFPGIGGSEGELESNSLALRLKVTEAAYDKLLESDPLMEGHVGVNATSIAGYTGIRLTETRQVKALALDAPAAYGVEADDKLWNGEFTEVIRKPNSWEGSLSFTALEHFSGDVILFYPEHDDVIPLPVQEKYREIVKDKGGEVVTLPDAGHRIHLDDSPINQAARKLLAKKSERFFTEHL